MINIDAVNSTKGIRYYVSWDGGNLHILNAKSLDWHMKKIMGLDSTQRKAVFAELNANGKVTIDQGVAA